MLTTHGPRKSVASRQELLHKLSLLRHKSAQNKFLDRHSELLSAESVIWISDTSRDQAKVDTARALSLAELAMAVALKISDSSARARSFRAMGNALYVSGKNEAAIFHHEKARKMFRKVGNRDEVARTLSASIQPLILTGRYDRALANAKEARSIFTSSKDEWRLARLDLNTGNIFHRQDRFREALKSYRRAHRQFSIDAEKDPEAMGVALHNIAMCLVSLNDFPGALAAHQEARAFAEKHGMRVLVAQTDYNIAALYYLQGQHSLAIRKLLETLEACQAVNDRYHVALCHLDLSEIYLQLNLSGPAEEMAQEASADFQKLGMGYEAGKSLVNLALAMARENKAAAALKMLANARRQFIEEKNSAWPFLTDFYQAIILTAQGRYREAWTRCLAANKFFSRARIPDKFVLTQLLLAQLRLLTGRLTDAAEACSRALGVLNLVELPLLTCQAHQLMGRIHMRADRKKEAYHSYEQALHLFETMRSDLRMDELKISFMEDKLEIYESLVELCLEARVAQSDLGQGHFEKAFTYIEQSKSRSLQDLMSLTETNDSLSAHESEAQNKATELRTEINWLSRKLVEEQLRDATTSPKQLSQLQSAIHKRERGLLRLARETPESETDPARLFSSKPATLEEIRASLPEDAALVEYFQIHDQLLAAVVTRTDKLNIVPVARAPHITQAIEHLEFQLGKFRLGAAYVGTFSDFLLKTIQNHLAELYRALFSPVEDWIKGQHLIIVPHGPLHRLPFQALFDGREYLIDKFSISYAPSATVHTLCHRLPINESGPALVMGIPDAAAPLILEESTTVAGILPRAELLLDGQATISALQKKGPLSRWIHIATHGFHRQDNPMFSGIRLGDSVLTLYDLYRLKLPSELITLSGCATGVSTVAGGDELLGLVRGLISAGARAALLSLWDVQDRSTMEFMISFYTHLISGENKAAALRKAVRNIRDRYPHPYYWAPFSLIGNTI